ncbi:MAG: tetratricopeptide repeat protein [bacterium]|nr:tetratricopeptide repeat protein [bacterium]
MQEEDLNIVIDEVVEESDETPRKSRFYGTMPFIGKLSYFVFLFTILLVPLFILPASSGFQLEFAKKILFSGGVLVSFVLWLITRLEDGKFTFPGGAIFWTSLLLVASFTASSLLAPALGLSVFGLGYENDTLVSTIVFFLAMFLASTFFDSRKRTFRFFNGLIITSLIIGAVELIQILSPVKLLSGGVLSNMIGKWNDFGIFFGLSLLLALVGLESPSLRGKKFKKSILWMTLALSIMMVTLANYNLIWVIVGVFALIVCIYSLARSGMFSEGHSNYKNIIFKPSFFVVIVAIVLFFGANSVGPVLNKYNIYQLEVRPSWQSTMEVAKATMQKSFYLGTGPNTFAKEWSVYKPDAVNSTIFWNTEFNVGFGRIPSYAITLGLFGLISAGLFLLSLVYYGYKALMVSFEDMADQLIILASFIASFYLWAFSIFYVTDTALMVLTFVFTGIFLASLSRAGLVRQYGFSFLNSPKLGFVAVLVIVLLIISVISGSYSLYKKSSALYTFQRGIYNFNQVGGIVEVERSIKSAIDMDEQDLYYRSLTEIGLIKLRSLLSGSSGMTKESLFQQLQLDLTSAAGSARKATELNPSNYFNWIALGKVGETVLPLKDVISGSYDLAIDSYNKALVLNPKNPSIYLNLAQVEVAKGDSVKAKEYIAKALAKKSNYTEALFLLSQIEAKQGNLPEAIAKAQQAAIFSPGDVGILFQLGLLKYTNKDYAGAVEALKAATGAQSNYANAKYFLGISYSKLGKVNDAIKEFEELSVLNPDSKEVANILINLKAGRGALENIVPPKNEPVAPEKRSKLPVKEKVKKETSTATSVEVDDSSDADN